MPFCNLFMERPLYNKGLPWDDLRKNFTWMSADGQRTKGRRNIAEKFNRLRVYERYRRQTTDGRTTTYSEREREFTFANKKFIRR